MPFTSLMMRVAARLAMHFFRTTPAASCYNDFHTLEMKGAILMVVWDDNRISNLNDKELRNLCENAKRSQRPELVALCEAEISKRGRPAHSRKSNIQTERRNGMYVSEFHFVCPQRLGLNNEPDGRVWTGTWVVAESHARDASNFKSIVALHATKGETSYLQGFVLDWRRSDRERKYTGENLTQIESGIDFLLELSHSPLAWQGNGSGEKGYAWAPIPQ